jgi:hypothetical protein
VGPGWPMSSEATGGMRLPALGGAGVVDGGRGRGGWCRVGPWAGIGRPASGGDGAADVEAARQVGSGAAEQARVYPCVLGRECE